MPYVFGRDKITGNGNDCKGYTEPQQFDKCASDLAQELGLSEMPIVMTYLCAPCSNTRVGATFSLIVDGYRRRGQLAETHFVPCQALLALMGYDIDGPTLRSPIRFLNSHI